MIFKTHLTKDTKKQKIYFSSSNLDDVLATVKVAEARYDLHRNKTSKLREGLSRFSKLLHHYANIIEVFVQHHPEYVALAWGAMKVVLVVSQPISLISPCWDSHQPILPDVSCS
jgi:hypothetical protein